VLRHGHKFFYPHFGSTHFSDYIGRQQFKQNADHIPWKTGTVDDLTFFSINRAIMAAPFSTGITKGRLGSMLLQRVSINPGCNTVTPFFPGRLQTQGWYCTYSFYISYKVYPPCYGGPVRRLSGGLARQ